MSNVYAELLGPTTNRRFVMAAAVGRLPMSILGLATITTISSTTGSYAIAGALSATMLVSQSLCAPWLGRLADRVGQSRLLLPVCTVHAVALLLIAVAAPQGADIALLAGLSVVVGASFPPLGPLVRQRWRHRVERGDQVLAAYSLESVLDEVIYVIGPLVVVLMALVVAPEWGLVACAVVSFAGSVMFVRCRASEPPRQCVPPARVRALQEPVRSLLLMALAVGTFVGATEISMIAAAESGGQDWAAGVLIALFSVGSVTTGLMFGARPPKGPPEQHLLWAGCGLVTAAIALLAVPTLWVYAPAVLLAGCLFAPSIILTYELLTRAVGEEALTEGFAWIQSALGLGLGVGTAGAGALVADVGARWGFAIPVLAGTSAAILAIRLARSGVAGSLST